MPSIFFVIIAIVCVLVFFLHLAVYKGVVAIFSLSAPATLLWLKVALASLGASFVVANILASKFNNIFTRIFYTVSASWYGFLFYLLIAVAIFAVLNLIFARAGNPTAVLGIGKALIFFALAVSAYGLWNAERMSVVRYEVALPDLPEAWQGRRAVWISDIHLDQVHTEKYAQKLVDKIKAENPDIVFIGGDLYDGVEINEAAAIAPLGELKPPLGVYFVTGNHEEFGDRKHYTDAIEALGIRYLDNELVDVEGVNILGVNDNDSTDEQIFESILSRKWNTSGGPTILLKHQPSELGIAERHGIDLQISGHTHRVQMWPLSYVSDIIYKGYSHGHKNYGDMQVITSDGVGTWGPPMRVLTKSEITVLEF